MAGGSALEARASSAVEEVVAETEKGARGEVMRLVCC